MELKDTIEGMNSADYKERFQAEYTQVSIRTRKLGEMLDKQKAGTLQFKPTCPRGLLVKQHKSMLQYLQALKVRAAYENITLVDG